MKLYLIFAGLPAYTHFNYIRFLGHPTIQFVQNKIVYQFSQFWSWMEFLHYISFNQLYSGKTVPSLCKCICLYMELFIKSTCTCMYNWIKNNINKRLSSGSCQHILWYTASASFIQKSSIIFQPTSTRVSKCLFVWARVVHPTILIKGLMVFTYFCPVTYMYASVQT